VKILIVDDSRVMRAIVTRTLRQAGYDGHVLLEASDGADALRQVQQQSPQLLLSDWNMPGMDGLELLRALRAGGSPVVFGFVTSEVSEHMRQRAKAAGARFLITKPFTAEAFREHLNPILG